MAKGRPTIYSDELAERILKRLAGGETLMRICEDDDLPTRGTFHLWVATDAPEHNGIKSRYLIARAAGVLDFADEIIAISDDSELDTKTVGKEGEEREVQNTEWISRSKLRVDSRKFLMMKFMPDVFGDRLNVGGVKDAPIETKDVTDAKSSDTLRRIAFLMLGKKAPAVR